MARVKSADELRALREQFYPLTALRFIAENHDRTIITVSVDDCGVSSPAKDVLHAIVDEINANAVDNTSVIATESSGNVPEEPVVEVKAVDKDPIRYTNVDVRRAREIVEKHIASGELSVRAGKEA